MKWLIQPRRNVKGLSQVWLEVVPPRKEWSLSANESPRSPARKQSTAHYARSMGAHRTPTTQVTEKVQFRWYSKKGFAGKIAHCSSCNEHESREQNNSYVQLSAKIAKLEKSNRKLSAQTKNASTIMIAQQ